MHNLGPALFVYLTEVCYACSFSDYFRRKKFSWRPWKLCSVRVGTFLLIVWVVVKSVVFFCSLSVVKDKITRESEKQKWRRIGRIHDIRCHNLLFHGNCDFLVYRAEHF